MNRKIILLLILLFTLTGCSIQYNLTVDENSIKEDTIIKFPKSQYKENDITPYSSANIPIAQETNQIDYYKSDLTEDSNNYYLSYNHIFPIDKFAKSYFATMCYPNITLEDNENTIKLSTENTFSCMRLQDSNASADSAQINITTALKVLKNNADEVNGNTYTWNINKNNYQNKTVNITIQKKDKPNETKNNSMTEGPNMIFIIVSGVALLLIIFILYMVIKIKKTNQI